MAKTAKSHKNQHYVPRCYTKAWHAPTSDAGSPHTPYVWVFDRDGSNARRRAPKNIFTENDMYTIVCPNGQRDLRLEHGFQELEDRFTRIRNLKFNRRVWPNSEELVWILSFIATAKVRTAAYRDFQRQQWGDIRRRMEELQSEFDKASPELQKTLIGTAGVSLRSGKGIELDEVQRLEARPIQEMIGSTLRTVIPALGKMHVGVLCTDDPLGFVTSDDPCTWFDPEAYKRQPIFRGPGLGISTIEVTFPISPRQCLIITHRSELRGFIEVRERAVDELNRRHIAHSNQVFISQNQETRAAWFEQRPMPEDAWEKLRERKIASGEWIV